MVQWRWSCLLWLAAAGAVGFVAGCNPSRDSLARFNGYYEVGDFNNCALFAEQKVSVGKDPGGSDLLWTLQAGSVERSKGDYERSTQYFDKAEEMLKYYDLRFEGVDIIGTTMVNENVLPYKGEEYDGVMVNAYKALNFMAQKNMDLARVEFNRALDRQRRAKEKFNEEISKLKSQIEAKKQKGENVQATLDNPAVGAALAREYPGLNEFQAYPDFVNPFVTYMAGVFAYIEKEYDKARDLFREAYGMVQDNAYIAEDLQVTEGILSGKSSEDAVWVIFENGLGPIKKEFRIDIPLFLVTNKVRYVGIALPRLDFRSGAYTNLLVQANGKDYKTSVAADIDRVIATEFKEDFQGILIRAIIAATAKAAAQYALEQQSSSDLAAIMMTMYSYATTAADVRIWTALPKDFQVCRFRKPADGQLKIIWCDGQGIDVDINDCHNAIVYVRIIGRQTVPVCDVMKF